MTGLRTPRTDVEAVDTKITLRQSGAADQIITALSIDGTTRGLRLDRITADIIGQAESKIALQLTGTRLELQTASLDSAFLNVDVNGQADIETLDGSVDFTVRTSKLAEVAAAYGVDVAGAIDISGTAARQRGDVEVNFRSALTEFAHALADASMLRLSGTVRDNAEGTSFDLRGKGQDMRIDRIGPDLLPEASLGLNGRLKGDRLDLSLLRIEGPLLDAVLDGTMDLFDQSGKVNYRLKTPELGKVARLYDVDAGGQVAATGTAEWLAPDCACFTAQQLRQIYRHRQSGLQPGPAAQPAQPHLRFRPAPRGSNADHGAAPADRHG